MSIAFGRPLMPFSHSVHKVIERVPHGTPETKTWVLVIAEFLSITPCGVDRESLRTRFVELIESLGGIDGPGFAPKEVERLNDALAALNEQDTPPEGMSRR